MLGGAFADASRALQVERGPLAIEGRIGQPEAARARADQQYLFVNGRFVRDRLLAHAVRAANEDQLHGSRQPVYALFLRIAPELVDVNVHPTKIEVRFRDGRAVHQALLHEVQDALASSRALPDDAPSVGAPTSAGAASTTTPPGPAPWQGALVLHDGAAVARERPAPWSVPAPTAAPAAARGSGMAAWAARCPQLTDEDAGDPGCSGAAGPHRRPP